MLFEVKGSPGCYLGHCKAKVCPNGFPDAFFYRFWDGCGLPFGYKNQENAIVFHATLLMQFLELFLIPRTSILTCFGVTFRRYFSTFGRKCQHWVGSVNTISKSSFRLRKIINFQRFVVAFSSMRFRLCFSAVFSWICVPLGDHLGRL